MSKTIDCPLCAKQPREAEVCICTQCIGYESKCPFKLCGKCYGRACLLCGNTGRVSIELAGAFALLSSGAIELRLLPIRTAIVSHQIIYDLYIHSSLLGQEARALIETFLLRPPY